MMNILLTLLLAITVNAGPDQRVHADKGFDRDHPIPVQLNGSAVGDGSVQWALPYPESLREEINLTFEDTRKLNSILYVYERGTYKIWLVGFDGHRVATDEVIIVVE